MKPAFTTAILVLAAHHLQSAAALAASPDYHLLKEIPIGGVAKWDYLKVDSEAHRLYVTHASKVEVIDLDKGAVVGSIENTPGVHGVAFAPALGRVYTSNGRENTASIVDQKTLKTLSRVPTGANPDSILFEPALNEVYTFNGKGKSATAFHPETGRLIATIDLGGKPEAAAADSSASRIYVNLEDKNEVVVIDSKAHKVVQHWPIAPGEAATGLALDPAHHRLFLGCDNKKMVMLDAASGKVVAHIPIGAGVDAVAFDPATQLAFSSNGDDGTVTIAHAPSPDQLVAVQTLKTVGGARTMALDPATHLIYLAAPTPAFRVLVYGPGASH